jgi:hypothetical protein
MYFGIDRSICAPSNRYKQLSVHLTSREDDVFVISHHKLEASLCYVPFMYGPILYRCVGLLGSGVKQEDNKPNVVMLF